MQLLDQLLVGLILGRQETFGLGHANHLHHLIVRADNVAVDAPRLGVVRTAALIVCLHWLTRICFACARHDDVVRRAALDVVRDCLKSEIAKEENLTRRDEKLTSACEFKGPSRVIVS